MSPFDFDAVVIGAGPAGAASALAAARLGLRVLLVDPQGEVSDKPCGEGLMPSGLLALAEIGIEDATREGFAFRELSFVHQGRDALDIELESDACAIARPALLVALARAIELETRVVRARAHGRVRALESGFEISMSPADHVERGGTATARTLIAADGAGGRAAAWLRGDRRARVSSRLGIRSRCEAHETLSRVEVHIGDGAEVYLTPLSPRAINVAVLLDRAPPGIRGATALCEWALDRHPRARARLGRTLTPPAARALDRNPPRSVSDGDAFLAGDAAGAVDPILGCGVAIALQSGIAAARAVRDRTEGELALAVARRYRAQCRSTFFARRELARGLCFLGSHPRIASGFLALLRASPGLRARICRIVGGDAPRAACTVGEPSATCAS
jgi:flavin-dependent dehydrogenase